MSQQIWASINPLVTSGTMLASILTDFKDAIMTGFSGTSRPAQLQAGGMWIDTTLESAPTYTWSFKMWTGTVDIEVFRLNVNNNYGGAITADAIFSVSQISADTVGAYQKLIKQRLLLNGQVASGDTVAEIQLVGRTSTATDPVVGCIKWVSTDDQTNLASGGYLTFYSTPDASATLTEHMRLISGLVETVVPHKLNSLRLVSQDVATASVIAQLSASTYGVEFTGSTATVVQGINAGQDTQELVIHNRSSAVITLSHQNTGASSIDRLKLPSGADITIEADGSATLFYDLTDVRWKIKSIQGYHATKTVKQFRGLISEWTVPTGVTTALVTTYKERLRFGHQSATILDVFGNAYAWGLNTGGMLGLGDVTPRSSPVAVLGGLQFKNLGDANVNFLNSGSSLGFTVGLTKLGVAYAWGSNAKGQLGVGDALGRSSPVAVVGGLKFISLIPTDGGVYGIATDGLCYVWGQSIGATTATTGGTTIVSSPVAMLGGLKFDRIWVGGSNSPITNDMSCGLDINGNAYAWGKTNGKGGSGDGTSTVTLSSPVAVIGGLTFKKLQTTITGTGSPFVIGLTKNGAAYAWGDNVIGQLGVGDVVSRSSPVAVLGGLTFMDIMVSNDKAAGGSCFGLTEAGVMYAWGNNVNGQLGVGDRTNRSSPVLVLGSLAFQYMASNFSSTFGITNSGDLYAWGANSVGQLGVGDNVDRSSPVAVLGGLKFNRIAHLGNDAMLAVTADGSVYSWGSLNDTGQLGDGTVVTKSSPVAVIGGFAHNTQSSDNVIQVTVTPGQTYQIYLPLAREARFGNIPIGIGLERVTIEYDTRGT